MGMTEDELHDDLQPDLLRRPRRPRRDAVGRRRARRVADARRHHRRQGRGPDRRLRGRGDEADPRRGHQPHARAREDRAHALLLRGPDARRDRRGARRHREPGVPDPHQGGAAAALEARRARARARPEPRSRPGGSHRRRALPPAVSPTTARESPCPSSRSTLSRVQLRRVRRTVPWSRSSPLSPTGRRSTAPVVDPFRAPPDARGPRATGASSTPPSPGTRSARRRRHRRLRRLGGRVSATWSCATPTGSRTSYSFLRSRCAVGRRRSMPVARRRTDGRRLPPRRRVGGALPRSGRAVRPPPPACWSCRDAATPRRVHRVPDRT